MERDGNYIINSVAEQIEFHLPRRTTVDIALETADAFVASAKQLQDLCVTELDSTNKAVSELNARRSYNATALGRYASGVYANCPDEQLERMARSAGK